MALHLQPALGDMYKSKVKKLKTSENLGKNGLYIPIGTHVSKQDQEYIIDSLLSIIELSEEMNSFKNKLKILVRNLNYFISLYIKNEYPKKIF